MVAIASHPEARADESSSSAWLISPSADLLALVLVTITALIPWYLSNYLHVHWRWLVMIAGFFSGTHLVSTVTRVYIPKDERFRRPLHYVLIPAALFAYVAWCRSSGEGMILLRTTLFYWASWHFMAQAFGILRLYQRKHGVFGTRLALMEKGLVFGPAIFFVVRRVFTGPWDLFGMPVLHPRFPPVVVNVLGLAVLVLAVVYVRALMRSTVRGTDWLRVTFLAANAFGFAIPCMAFKDGSSGFASAAIWHAIQYIAIVWIYNRKHYDDRPVEAAGDRLLSWLTRPGRAGLYIAALGVPGVAAYVGLRVMNMVGHVPLDNLILTVWSAGTLAHYYLDGVIWKRRRYDMARLA